MREVLVRVESLLSLLHYRGLVDSELNRQDVKEVLDLVQGVLYGDQPLDLDVPEVGRIR